MDTRMVPTSRGPAPYGRSCTCCVAAKSKCILDSSLGGKCERCHRLKKDCQPSRAARKRSSAKRITVSKTAQLEEKLNGVIDLLRRSGQPVPAFAERARGFPSETKDTNTDYLYPSYAIRTSSSPVQLENVSRMRNQTILPLTPATSTGSTSTTLHSPAAFYSTHTEPSLREAQHSFETFRDKYLRWFPFVFFPQSISATEFREQRPFQWLCIMAISAKSSEQRLCMDREIRLTLGRRIILDGERNKDLLLGLLTYVAWGHSSMLNKPIYTTTLQIAIGLLYDLGIHKPPQKELSLGQRCIPELKSIGQTMAPRTVEDRRILIGLFLVSSAIATGYRRIEAMRWTNYMEESLQVVMGDFDCPIEPLWLHIICLQKIVGEAAQWNWLENAEENSAKVPLMLYLNSLKQQLADVKQKIPLELEKNRASAIHQILVVIQLTSRVDIICLQVSSAELSVNEIVLSKPLENLSNTSLQRLECLWACLNATKSYCNTFLQLPAVDCVYLSVQTYAQMSHHLMVAHQLLTLDDSDWDKKIARENLDLSSILDKLVRKMNEVSIASGLHDDRPGPGGLFIRVATKMEAMKSYWDSQLALESAASDNAVQEAMAELPMDFSDDLWLNAILEPWSY